jgi:hypothetical protein
MIFWGLPVATLTVLDNIYAFNIYSVVNDYLFAIIMGACFGVLTYPFVIIAKREKNAGGWMGTNDFNWKNVYPRVKNILFSHLFSVASFCLISTLFLANEIAGNSGISFSAIVLRYALTGFLGFMFKYYLLFLRNMSARVHMIWKRYKTEEHVSCGTYFKTWAYVVWFFGGLIIGPGVGTLGVLSINFPGIVSPINLLFKICIIYVKGLAMGLTFGGELFVSFIIRKEQKTLPMQGKEKSCAL